jgi:hypothetical protein
MWYSCCHDIICLESFISVWFLFVAFAEIEKAMRTAEASGGGRGWGSNSGTQHQYDNVSSSNGTNFNASAYSYESNSRYGGGVQAQYDGSSDMGQSEWFNECRDCQCCGGYKYSCMCCQMDQDGYQASGCCMYCYTGDGGGDYAGNNSGYGGSNSNYGAPAAKTTYGGYNNQLGRGGAGSGAGARLNTQASEWVPGMGFGAPVAASAAAPVYPTTVFKAGNVHFPQGKSAPPQKSRYRTIHRCCYLIVMFQHSVLISHCSSLCSDNVPICDFFTKNQYCKQGKKCKFRHIYQD